MDHESPAFRTFTIELMYVARAVELVVHATSIDDPPLAARQRGRLLRHLATLDHALLQLQPPEHLAACALFGGLEQRLANASLGDAALAQCLTYLRRFR